MINSRGRENRNHEIPCWVLGRLFRKEVSYMKALRLLFLGILLCCGCEKDKTEESTDTSDTDTNVDAGDASLCPFQSVAQPGGAPNWVNGSMIELNDNGGWCWYQDERVIVDETAGRLVIGSVVSGGDRARQVEVTHYDLATKQLQRFVLGTVSYTDDHDAPSFIQRPTGGYAAMWAGHNDDCYSYHNVFDGTTWSAASTFDWTPQGCPTSTGETVTYANLWYMGGTLYSFVRSVDTSPNFIYSTDGGLTYQNGGRLSATPQIGYVAGYYKYWGNNVDRIDFLGTEAHPRQNDNNLWHGYVKREGDAIKIYNSFDVVVDENALDGEAQNIDAYTQVIATGTVVNGEGMVHLWNSDLVRYDDGTIAAIGTARVSGSIGAGDPEKRLLYFRFDGTKWNTTYLAPAGQKLYENEQDYTGLGALDPDDPRVIYISTPFNPSTGAGDYAGKKEIWKGVTCDNGATFSWEPVTANSDVDNLRPIVPKWNAENTALLWLRGTYITAQEYNQKIVGLID